METDIQSIFMAQTITEEKLRNKGQEAVRLERGNHGPFTQLLQDLFRSFH
jgi:hypothetical protein